MNLNPENKNFPVEYKYTGCGHTEKFSSPGPRDPSGILAAITARCSDDVIRIEDIGTWKCPGCEPGVDKTFSYSLK